MGFEESLGDPRDRNTAESDLRALATSQDPIVKLHIAHNPSTPGDVLAMLAMQDDFEIDQLEEDWEPFDYQIDGFFLEDVGDWIDSFYGVIARNPNTPDDILENLFFSGAQSFNVSCNPRLNDAIVRKIWGTGDTQYMVNILAANECLTDAFMIDVASKPDVGFEGDSIKSRLAGRDDCPAFVLEMLLRQDPEKYYEHVRAAVLGNKNCPEKFLREYSAEAHGYHRAIVAGNPSTPPEVLTQLAQDADETVRKALASYRSAPTDILTQLAQDADETVRKAVASNHSAPTDILNQLANDPAWVVRSAVASNLSTPPDVLTQLAVDPESFVRNFVSINPSTPPDVRDQVNVDD